MEELSSLSDYVCDDSHTHGQSRGKALKLAENYTFSLTDFIHNCFRSRASPGKDRPVRERLAVPAMSTTSKMYGRALASAGLAAVPNNPTCRNTWPSGSGIWMGGYLSNCPRLSNNSESWQPAVEPGVGVRFDAGLHGPEHLL